MTEFIVTWVAVFAIIYAVGFLVVARRAALSKLGPEYSSYGYDLGEYAGAGMWGLLLGTFWPVLAAAVVFGAGVGWLLTRFK